MTFESFHEWYDHLGVHGPCAICILAGGCMRRIYHKVDPYKEVRPMHTIAIDTITWSHRSHEGNKYEILCKDVASSLTGSLYLYTRDQSLEYIKQWVKAVESNPALQSFGYKPVSIMILDNAGEWELNYSEFQNMAEELEFGLRYTSKDRKEESCHAERGIGIKEPKVKAALMQLNLPPQYWQKKSKELNWLMARFPVQSQSAKIPSDGDRMRPLEHATQGYVSRRQIDRELYYFVPIGTPCLVHDEKAKGSQLPHSSGDGCKSQWMIADGMYREQVLFWNPRTNRTIKSKSYTTFALR